MEDRDEWIPTRQGTGQGTPATVTPEPILQFTQNQYTPLAAEAEAELETAPATPLEAFAAAVLPSALASVLLPTRDYRARITGTEEQTTHESRILTVNTRTTIPQVITVPTTEEDNLSIDSPIQPVDIALQYTTAPTTPQYITALNHKFARLHHDDDSDGTSSTDSETDLYNSTDSNSMGETDNPTEVQDLFLAEQLGDLTPIITPTRMQIITFTDTIATALTQCRSKLGLLGAQAYLVLTKEEYKMRVNNQDKDIPMRPSEPAPYDNNAHTRRTWKEFEHKLGLYSETHRYDWQVIALIKLKFPKSLHGLYDKYGHLNLDTTAIAALEKVKDNIVDKSETTRCCQEIRTNLSGRKHTRAANGAED